MDYSSIVANDPEHPSGSSPWDSPGADRSTFVSTGASDIPPSPLSASHQSPYGDDRESHRSDSPETVGDDDVPSSPDLSERLQGAQLGDPDYVEKPPYASRHNPYRQHSR